MSLSMKRDGGCWRYDTMKTRVIGVVITALALASHTLMSLVWSRYDSQTAVQMNVGQSPLPQDVNINSAAAAEMARYLLTHAANDMPHDGGDNETKVVGGDTESWRQGLHHDGHRPSTTRCPNTSRPPRRLYVIRHTEKLSKVLPNWVELAFTTNGTYRRVDLNMPIVLPRRPRHPEDIESDPPISMTGHIQAWLIGYCLKEMGVSVSHVYSSPTLRCIESASTMLLGMAVDVEINVEPALLEWFKWSENSVVMDMDSLRRFKLKVNKQYKPYIPYDKIDISERRLHEYDRCSELAKIIVDRHKDQGGDILIVGHLSTMETITRKLSGGQPLDRKTFKALVYEKPFGLISVLEEDCSGNGSWHKVLPPVIPITWKARLLWSTQHVLNFLLT